VNNEADRSLSHSPLNMFSSISYQCTNTTQSAYHMIYSRNAHNAQIAQYPLVLHTQPSPGQ